MKTAYKILFRKQNGTLNSFIPQSLNPYAIVYPLDTVITPSLPNSKLFVFDTIQSALLFCHSWTAFSLWEVEVDNPQPLYRQVKASYYRKNIIAGFWKNYVNCVNTQPEYTEEIHSGTLGVDSIKLIKQVPEEEFRGHLKKDSDRIRLTLD